MSEFQKNPNPEDDAQNTNFPGEEFPPSADQSAPQQPLTIKFPPRKPVVTWILLGITVLVYIAQVLTESLLGVDLPLAAGAKFGPLIDQSHQWWRLITPLFLHGSITHILFNMYALYAIGPDLEMFYGHRDFLLFYLITGFAGNVLSFIASPMSYSVGASTALFGMIAAQGFLIYKNKKLFHNYRRAIYNILLIIFLNLMIGMNSRFDNWGHLGGLIAGAIIAFLCGPVLEVRVNNVQNGLELFDSVSKKSRYIAYFMTTLFFTVAAITL